MERLEGLTVKQLRELAKARSIPRYSKMNRGQLLEALSGAANGASAKDEAPAVTTAAPVAKSKVPSVATAAPDTRAEGPSATSDASTGEVKAPSAKGPELPEALRLRLRQAQKRLISEAKAAFDRNAARLQEAEQKLRAEPSTETGRSARPEAAEEGTGTSARREDEPAAKPSAPPVREKLVDATSKVLSVLGGAAGKVRSWASRTVEGVAGAGEDEARGGVRSASAPSSEPVAGDRGTSSQPEARGGSSATKSKPAIGVPEASAPESEPAGVKARPGVAADVAGRDGSAPASKAQEKRPERAGPSKLLERLLGKKGQALTSNFFRGSERPTAAGSLGSTGTSGVVALPRDRSSLYVYWKAQLNGGGPYRLRILDAAGALVREQPLGSLEEGVFVEGLVPGARYALELVGPSGRATGPLRWVTLPGGAAPEAPVRFMTVSSEQPLSSLASAVSLRDATAEELVRSESLVLVWEEKVGTSGALQRNQRVPQGVGSSPGAWRLAR